MILTHKENGFGEMLIPPINNSYPPYVPIPTVQPFTYRDGLTYWEKLNYLIRYIKRHVLPYIDAGDKATYDQLIAQFEIFTDQINDKIADINEIIQAIIDNSIIVQDPLVAQMINDVNSTTRQALDEILDASLTPINGSINEITNDVKSINNELAFNLLDSRAEYVNRLDLSAPSRMQCVVRAENGEYFASQGVDGSTGTNDPQSVRISHTDANGRLIDTMTLVDSFHGTSIGVEYVNDTPYIWMPWLSGNPWGATKELVRFPYVPGKTMTRADTSITSLNRFGDSYVMVQLDPAENIAVYRTYTVPNGYGQDKYVKRYISEAKAGIDNPLGTITLPNGNQPGGVQITMQGFATIGDTFYRLTGNGSEYAEPNIITAYNWADGSEIGTLNVDDLGLSPDGTYGGGNFQEPEGLSTFRDADGNPQLYAGVVVGTNNADFKFEVYSFSGALARPDFDRSIRQIERVLPYTLNGVMRNVHHSITKISDITSPGYYYLTGSGFEAMEDKPDGAPSSGYMLYVSGNKGGSPAGAYQELTRYTLASNTPTIVYRRGISWTDSGSSHGDWYRLGGIPTDCEILNTTTTSLSDISRAGYYYLNGAVMAGLNDAPSGAPSAGYILTVSPNTGNDFHVQTLNRITSNAEPTSYRRIINAGSSPTQGPWYRETLEAV